MSDIINDHKTLKKVRVHSSNEVFDYETQHGQWKIQLTKSVNFILSNGSDETCNMHTKSNNIEIMMGSEIYEIIDELFESLLQNNFVFDSVDLLYYHVQKTILKRTRSSYMGSPEWLKNKKATINPKNNDNCFHI